MTFIDEIIKKVESFNKEIKILLIDGDDIRAQEAALKLKQIKNITPILLIEKELKNKNIVMDIEIININENKDKINLYEQKYVELRKGKETLEQAHKFLATRPFYAAMMLKENEVDAVIGGLSYATSDILRPAFKIIGPKEGINTISSIMIMHKDNDKMIFSDISVNPNPDEKQLVEIGLNAAAFAKQFDFEDKIAFLSFSTSQSAVTPESQKIINATQLFNNKYGGNLAIGEIQLDAAVDQVIRKSKYKGTVSFEGSAQIFIFPDLGAGNIGYKLVQRFGYYGAIGPIIVGMKQPMNDLSRGSTVDDVFYTAIISAIQANK